MRFDCLIVTYLTTMQRAGRDLHLDAGHCKLHLFENPGCLQWKAFDASHNP